MTTYIFRTPYVEEGPTGQHRLFYFFKLRQGLTVTRNGSLFKTGRYFTQDQLDAVDEYWLGGHESSVSEATKAALIAGGIGVTEANFTAEQGQMDCNHIGKVLEWGFTETHDFKATKWGCVLCDETSDTPLKGEEEIDIDHTNCDEDCFGCKARGLQLNTGDAGKPVSKKNWEGRLKFYKDARNQGIQPAGTHPVQVEAAYKASETLGKAYDAGTMGVRADKVTKSVAAVMKETGAA